MQPHSGGLITALILLIILSAFFSASEMAYSSLNIIKMKNLASKNKKAARVLTLHSNFDKLLSTILIGNNVVNIASTSIATVLFIGALGSKGAGVATAVMTVIVLIFGEISPKSLAKEAAESFTMATYPILIVFVTIFTPFNFIFSKWKKLLNKLIKTKEELSEAEAELLTIVNEYQNEGSLDENEGKLIRSAIEFSDVTSEDILTPRVDIEYIEIEDSISEITEKFKETGFSRMPVCSQNIDNILGIVHEKDFYRYRDETNDAKELLEHIMKPPLYVTSNKKIASLLSDLQKTKSHMAIVTDEYGGTYGIVTLEDILEELVGEIWDEHDEITAEFVRIKEDKYKVLCSADLDDLFELFGMENEFEHNSISRWVMENLEKIPELNDRFAYEDLFVIVTQVDGRRPTEIVVFRK